MKRYRAPESTGNLRGGKWRARVVVPVAGMLALGGCIARMQHTVTYRVTSGDGCTSVSEAHTAGRNCAPKASISYTNGLGESESVDADLPWEKAVFTNTSVAAVKVTAQISTASRVRVTIDVDGTQMKRSESSGKSAIASADTGLGWVGPGGC